VERLCAKRYVPADVEKLKQQPGKQTLTYGSGTPMYALLVHDLVDELRLGLYPWCSAAANGCSMTASA